ncbi:hypothetical protein CYMTET_56408 [Cymbomonas tetramitiformis]|uniref:Uncharacterized protein n=1 Tax=Cymbomonas tetramitiformis TaxID=36881 RepID=A0AAE0EML0_9CHLO|nr:hypothetical protein CYMTET_56408 [Cymbomonas tetramitiformis]
MNSDGRAQVLEIWLKMVEAVNSWSFVFSTLKRLKAAAEAAEQRFPRPEVARGEEECSLTTSVYLHVAERLRQERAHPAELWDQRRNHPSKRWKQLCDFYPRRFLADYGVREYLKLTKRAVAPGDARLVPRVSLSLSEPLNMDQVNDTLLPEKECLAVLNLFPNMEKTKTKDDWTRAQTMVNELDPELFCNPDTVARMSRVLCAKWSDPTALQHACVVYFGKLLDAVRTTHDCAPLTDFALKCSNLGNKRQFLIKCFSSHCERFGKRRVALCDVQPLLEALITRVEDLAELVHATGYAAVCGATAAMFYRLLAAEASLDKRVAVLKSCAFSVAAQPMPLDECVECDALEFWAELDAQQDATWTSAEAEVKEVPMEAPCALCRKMGREGEGVMLQFLASAKPTQLRELLSDPADFRRLCEKVVVHGWQLDGSVQGLEAEALVQIITEWYPALFTRLGPKVWEAPIEEEGARERVKRLLLLKVPDLDTLPRPLWDCVDFSMAREEDLQRLAEAEVLVPLQSLEFEKLRWSSQQRLLEMHSGNVEDMVTYVPMVVGPITAYLTLVFDLLAKSEARLVEIGDGLNDEDKRLSGWNMLLNTLLCGIRDRIKTGNVLHSSEQLVLFDRAVENARGGNVALLADLMESKNVDQAHVAPLVNFLLSGLKKLGSQVRDSALRAMMRLSPADRDDLHTRLLSKSTQLPIQVTFALSVTELHEQNIPLVQKQLDLLSVEAWDELLSLICNANPSSGQPHTCPRSLKASFRERFLVKYLFSKPPKDVRPFLLFVACTTREELPSFMIDVCARQLHPLNKIFLDVLNFSLDANQFRMLIEFIPVRDWNTSVVLDWVLIRVCEAAEPCVLLRVLMEHLQRKEFETALYIDILQEIIRWKIEGGSTFSELLKQYGCRDIMHHAVQHTGVETRENRPLWITFFKVCWRCGVPLTSDAREAELGAELDLKKRPLQRQEVFELGVDLNACKLLVRLEPKVAIQLHGMRILREDPAFARTLSDQHFNAMKSWSNAKDDSEWPLYRQLICKVEPDRALRLAISLLKCSREERDIELVKNAFHTVDNFVRKQTDLRRELTEVWKKFGVQIQKEVIDAITIHDGMQPSISKFVPNPKA